MNNSDGYEDWTDKLIDAEKNEIGAGVFFVMLLAFLTGLLIGLIGGFLL